MNKKPFYIFCLLSLAACNSSPIDDLIPNVPVNIELNLSDIDNLALQQIGGFVYLDGGVRGIILIRTSFDTYEAMDRNCTYQPTSSQAIVSMDSSGFFMEDKSCQSTFNLSGIPTGGPA